MPSLTKKQSILISVSDSTLSSNNKSAAKRITSSPELWICLYFLSNLILTIHNKWVLSKLNFNFPWTLTAIHIGLSGIGAFLFERGSQPSGSKSFRSSWSTQGKLLVFSVLYAVNIAVSNVSLAYVSLSFHQLVRSTTPIFTILMERIFLAKGRSFRIYLSLIPVVLGVSLATVDEFSDVSFTLFGFMLTLLGVLLSAAKGIVTNIMMVGSMKLRPLELIWRMSIPSTVQCLVYGTIVGEMSGLKRFGQRQGLGFNWISASMILANGGLAMLLNIASFTANKKTSALAMTVAGNLKQVFSIILAIYIFQTTATILNVIGAIIALAGGAWYSYESYVENFPSPRVSRRRTISELANNQDGYERVNKMTQIDEESVK